LKMKILLANPSCKKEINRGYEKYFIRAGSRWPHSSIKRKGELPHYLPFPFFLAYTAALLLRKGFEVEVIDAVALDMEKEAFLERVEKISPEFILFETTTPTVDEDLTLIEEIKRKSRSPRIILCGPHATVFYKELLKSSSAVDFIALGEYEYTILELLSAIRERRGIDNIPGLASRGKEGVVEEKSLIAPLDKLPFPSRDIFPENKSPNVQIYWDSFCQNRPAVQMHTSRGCPYHCYFCVWNQIMYRNGKYRLSSPKRVVDEMEEVINKYGAREIYFDDDDFTISRKHVLDICQEIKRRNLKVKWSCMGDAINLDEEEIYEMASSGCIGMKFGVESGSPKVLREIGKPINLKRVKQITYWCNKYRIKTHAAFSVGLLHETEKDMEKSLKFANGLNVDTIQVSICTPFPGTIFYEEALKEGHLFYSSWNEFDGKSKSIIQSPDLKAERIEKFRRKFFQSWLLHSLFRPSWIMRNLYYLFRSIRGIGLKFLLARVYDELKDELKIK